MSAAFSRGKSGNQSIYVPLREGFVQRSTGTKIPQIVRAMKRAVQQAKDERRWAILEAIRDKRLTLPSFYEAHASNTLDLLEARLAARNLADHLDGWIGWVRASRRDDVRTPDVYWQQVTTLIPAGGTFLAPELTKERVKGWLAGLDVTSGTRRKYLYALKSFVGYLLDAGVMATDPLAGMKAPKKNHARERYESAAVDQAITDAAMPKYRALFAFVKGTGADLGAALRAQKGDVDLDRGVVNLRGTKTDRRKVHEAVIEAWALPYLKAHLGTLVGRHTLLFAGITRHAPSHHHTTCCRAVGVKDYTLKDSRHSVAVRMRKRGAAFEQIAEQLGTSVFQAVTVYSRYKPDSTDATTTATATRTGS